MLGVLTKNSGWGPTPGLEMMVSLGSGVGHRKQFSHIPFRRTRLILSPSQCVVNTLYTQIVCLTLCGMHREEANTSSSEKQVYVE